ncbi:MAG: hypothetical protein VB064_04075 [Oscillospiraceae bacterium]|nr:hypothetical protein [Oscillospiraceae bacterium]
MPLSSKYAALKGLILLLLPALCCFAIDIIADGHIGWGPYIWGGEGCLFVFAFLPKLFNRPKLSYCLIADTAVTFMYLFLVGYLNGAAKWVLPLGLPLTLLTGLLLFSLITITQMRRLSHLFKSGAILFTTGVFVLAVEIVIDMFRLGAPTLGWTLPVFLPMLAISAAMFYIEYDCGLKARIVRAVFL